MQTKTLVIASSEKASVVKLWNHNNPNGRNYIVTKSPWKIGSPLTVPMVFLWNRTLDEAMAEVAV